MIKKIALDAGHGLKTAGKQTPDGIKEWLLNDKVRDKVANILSDYNVDIIHTDNDEGNVDETLKSRLTKYINEGVAAFVSFHHNAFTGKWNNATGVEVYTDANPTNADLELANLVYQKLVSYTGLKGRGVKHTNFYVINQNKIPAVLVEGGFMDGTNDYNIITSDKGQTAYARAVAESLIEFLKLEKKIDNQVKNTPFIVKVEISNLNIRKGAGTNHSITGQYTGIGTFTIVEVKDGQGSNSGWGRLKSGAGWISLDFAKRI